MVIIELLHKYAKTYETVQFIWVNFITSGLYFNKAFLKKFTFSHSSPNKYLLSSYSVQLKGLIVKYRRCTVDLCLSQGYQCLETFPNHQINDYH